MRKNLTESSLRALKPADRDYYIQDAKYPGFSLRVFKSGKITFYYSTKIQKKTKTVRIGSWPELSLKLARLRYHELAYEITKQAGSGAKQLLMTDDERLITIIRRFNSEYLEIEVAAERLRRKTADLYFNNLVKLMDILGGKDKAQLSDITHERLKRELKDIGLKQNKPSTANRLKEAVASLCKWLAAQEQGILRENPVTGIQKFKENIRTRRLYEDDLKKFFTTLKKSDAAPQAKAAIKLFLITGFRASEMLTSLKTWVTLTTEQPAWSLPSVSVKTDNSFRQPIPEIAKPILEKLLLLNPESPFLFPMPSEPSESLSARGIRQTMSYICKTAGIEKVTPHDLRRTCGSLLVELGVPLHIVSLILNHKTLIPVTTTNKHYIVYAYAQEKLEALNKLGSYYQRLGLETGEAQEKDEKIVKSYAQQNYETTITMDITEYGKPTY